MSRGCTVGPEIAVIAILTPVIAICMTVLRWQDRQHQKRVDALEAEIKSLKGYLLNTQEVLKKLGDLVDKRTGRAAP